MNSEMRRRRFWGRSEKESNGIERSSNFVFVIPITLPSPLLYVLQCQIKFKCNKQFKCKYNIFGIFYA